MAVKIPGTQALTYDFDLAICAAVKALRLMGVPPPKRVHGGTVAFEALLLHTRMGWMTSGYSHLSRLIKGDKKKTTNKFNTTKKGGGGDDDDDDENGGDFVGNGVLVARAIVGCW